MSSPSQLVRDARSRAGLSSRALAERAGVSPSTITRVESGRIDPTTGMLERILAAAGGRLRLEVDPAPRLAELVRAWHPGPADSIDSVDFTVLRIFIDRLLLEPVLVASAIADAPPPSGSAFMDNLLAGIAEKLADDAGTARPGWTTRVPPLDHPYEPRGPVRVRERAARTTPDQLRARGLLLERESLWRRR
jgi:transcriptional regulator with XRE-family HTH domain